MITKRIVSPSGKDRGYGFDARKAFLNFSASILLNALTKIKLSLGLINQAQWVSGHEADHSPPTSAKVKKTWIYTSTPPYFFMA
jgi:hypothetical protein